jgi:hypothetical protein
MQMFLWNGKADVTLTINPGNLSLDAQGASFGPQVFDVTQDIAMADDGGGITPLDACEAIPGPNGMLLNGKIALADRGNCNFTVKAINVQAVGAVGLLVANNVAGGSLPGMGGTDPAVTIPSFGISLEDGAMIRAMAMSGTVSANMHRGPSEIDVDGTIESTTRSWRTSGGTMSTTGCRSAAATNAGARARAGVTSSPFSWPCAKAITSMARLPTRSMRHGPPTTMHITASAASRTPSI